MYKICFVIAFLSLYILQCESVSSGRSSPTNRPATNYNQQRPGTEYRQRPPASPPDAVDLEILSLSERLFEASLPNIFNEITVNTQRRTYSSALTDDAPAPLLSVNNTTLSRVPTIAKLRALFNNYELDTMIDESVTPVERQEEDEFLEKILDTAVMRTAMDYLKEKGSVRSDRANQKNFLKTIWFTLYSRGGGRIGSSGFEHVFMNEIKNNEISGLHNWVYFHDQENYGPNNLDYKGYLKSLNLGNKAQLLKYRVGFKNLNKPVNTMFIGTLPELEIALYTVCLEMRKTKCDVSLGGKKFSIKVYPFFYRGKRVIGSAYPEF